MQIHSLKTHPEYFEAVKQNIKDFEVRKSDRPFKKGDILHLKEYDPEEESYTGREVFREITYILLGGSFGIDREYCVLSISELQYSSAYYIKELVPDGYPEEV